MRPFEQASSIAAIWQRYDEAEQRLSAVLSERMLDLAEAVPGMNVLDLATGRGEPAIRAAHRVAPSGRVVGIDTEPKMLDMARTRADRESISNLELLVQSAEDLIVDQPIFDVALARWGLMYMQDPVRALRATRQALKANSKIVAALWAEPERVSYFSWPRRILARYRTIPSEVPDQPGTFRYAHLDVIRRDFDRAGLAIESVEEMDLAVMEAETGEQLFDWVWAFGISRLCEDLPDTIVQAYRTDLMTEAKKLQSDGWIRLGGVTRIVVARTIP